MKKLPVLVLASTIVAGCGGKEDRVEKHLERAESYLAENNFEKARVEFRNVLQMEPKNIDALYGQAQVHEKLENWREAAGAYQRVSELDESNWKAKERLARLYFLGRAPDKALEMVEQVLVAKPDSAVALTVKGAVSAQQQDYETAMSLAEQALSAMPGYLDAIMLKASLLNQKNDSAQALQVLENGLQHQPDNPGLITVMAQIHATQGNQDKAIELLQKLVLGEPDNLSFRAQLVSYLLKLDRKDQAEAVLRDGVQQSPGESEVKLALVRYLAKMKGEEAAFAQLREFISEDGSATELQLELASLYEQAGKQDQAKQELKRIIDAQALKPDGLKARVQLARINAAAGDDVESKRLVNEVLKENPRDNDGLLLRAKLSLRGNDLIGAIADLRGVLRDQPDSFEVLNLLGRAHLANKEVDLAREHLDRAATLSANPAVTRSEVGQLYLQAGQTEAALRQLELASQYPAADSTVFQTLLKAQLLQKDYQAARKTAVRIGELQPQTGIAEYLTGLVDVAEGDSAAAIDNFSKSLAKAPGAVEPLSALIKTRLGTNQTEAAVADVKAVLKVEPGHFAAQNILGELYLLQGKTEQAVAELRKAKALKPELVSPYRNLAAAHVRLDDRATAAKVLEDGLANTGQAEALVVDLASLHESAGEIDKAIKLYDTALEKSPVSLTLSNNLAMLLVSHKNDQASLDRAGKLIEPLKKSENPAYLDTYGWVSYVRGDLLNAQVALEQAVKAAPEQALLRYHLGMTQFKNGDLVSAKENLSAALNDERGFKEMESARAVLQQISQGG